jgi:glucose-6-phosphate isomerase
MVHKRKKSILINYLPISEARKIKELEKVLLDARVAQKEPETEIYYMVRGVNFFGNLRFDITIFPPKMLGKEYVKTKGHFHVGNFGELYQVLEGEGIFLLQKGKEKVTKVYFVRARKGDFVKIPPEFGHITINPSKKILIVGNWVANKMKSDYESLEKLKGACYYFTKEGWMKNKNYQIVPNLTEKKATKRLPENLNFLFGK